MLATHHDTAARLKEAAAAEDLLSLRNLAHSVKGSAGNLQADGLRILAAEAERAARDGTDGAAPKAEELALAVDALMAAARNWMDSEAWEPSARLAGPGRLGQSG